MTITPDQAKTLLDGATDGPWRSMHDEWEDLDGNPCEDFYVLGGPDGILHTEDFDPDTHDPVANTALAAAAPDLARTVIDQGEKLEKVKSTVAAYINKRTEVITALLNSPEPNADYWRWQGHAESRRQLAHELGWTVPHNRGETTSQEAEQ